MAAAETADISDLPGPDAAHAPDAGDPPPPLDAGSVAAPPVDYGSPGARADIEFADGGSGSAWFFDTSEGMRVYVRVRDMRPGTYAMHVHETGDCSAPDFSSAGPHLGENAGEVLPDRPDDFEAGVLPDLEVGDDGSGALTALLEVVTFTEDSDTTWPLLDGDRTAIVIHRFATGALAPGEDNPRQACGEIFASEL